MGDLTVLDVDVELKLAASLFFELFDLTSLVPWRHTMVRGRNCVNLMTDGFESVEMFHVKLIILVKLFRCHTTKKKQT